MSLLMLLVAGGLAAAIAIAVATAYQRDLREDERRVSGRSNEIQPSFGRLEYAIAGNGPPLLMVHDNGGGFDQGLTFAAVRLQHHRTVAFRIPRE